MRNNKKSNLLWFVMLVWIVLLVPLHGDTQNKGKIRVRFVFSEEIEEEYNLGIYSETIQFYRKTKSGWEKRDHRKNTFSHFLDRDTGDEYWLIPEGTWKIKKVSSIDSPYKGEKQFQVEEGDKKSLEVKLQRKKRYKCSLQVVDAEKGKPIQNHSIKFSKDIGLIQVERDNETYVYSKKSVDLPGSGKVSFYLFDNSGNIKVTFPGSSLSHYKSRSKTFSIKNLQDGGTLKLKRKTPRAYMDVRFRTEDGVQSFRREWIETYFPEDDSPRTLRIDVYEKANLPNHGKKISYKATGEDDIGVFSPEESKFYFYNLKKNKKYFFYQFESFSFQQKLEKPFKLRATKKYGEKIKTIIIDLTNRKEESDENKQDEDKPSTSVTIQLNDQGKKKISHEKVRLQIESKEKTFSETIRFEEHSKDVQLPHGKYQFKVKSPYRTDKTFEKEVGKDKKITINLPPAKSVAISISSSDGAGIERGKVMMFDGKKPEPAGQAIIMNNKIEYPKKKLKKGSLMCVFYSDESNRKSEGARIGMKEVNVSQKTKKIDYDFGNVKEYEFNIKKASNMMEELKNNYAILLVKPWKESFVPIRSIKQSNEKNQFSLKIGGRGTFHVFLTPKSTDNTHQEYKKYQYYLGKIDLKESKKDYQFTGAFKKIEGKRKMLEIIGKESE